MYSRLDTNAGRQKIGIVNRIHLARTALMDDDIRWFYSDSNQVCDDIGYHDRV